MRSGGMGPPFRGRMSRDLSPSIKNLWKGGMLVQLAPAPQNHNRPCTRPSDSSNSFIGLPRLLRALAILATLITGSSASALPPPEILVLSVDPHNSKGL